MNEHTSDDTADSIQPDIGEAFSIIQNAMQNDLFYAYGWHCNLKFAYFDSFPDIFWTPDDTEKHKIANDAASTFMSRCWGVKTSDTMLEDNKYV